MTIGDVMVSIATPNVNKWSTDSTNKQAAPTREGKSETDKAHGRLQWCHLQLKNLPLKNFSGGQICIDEWPFKNSKNVDFDCIMKAYFDERNYEFVIGTNKMLFCITHLQYSSYYKWHYLLTKPCTKLLNCLQCAILLTCNHRWGTYMYGHTKWGNVM